MKKRFYKQAAVIALDGGGRGVALDGRPIRTPGGAQLSAPTQALAEAHDARLAVTQGIGHVAQDEAALDALRAAVEALDDHRLAAVSQLTASCGSLVTALAVEAGRIGAEQAIEASQLDEDWQAEQWGQDREAADRRRNVAAEIEQAVRFLGLLAA